MASRLCINNVLRFLYVGQTAVRRLYKHPIPDGFNSDIDYNKLPGVSLDLNEQSVERRICASCYGLVPDSAHLHALGSTVTYRAVQ